MRDIQKEIDEKLNEIEGKEGVRVLHAIESGSRAWGGASPDSDYDVRFVYVRKMEDYLRLDEPKDTIDWQLIESRKSGDIANILSLWDNASELFFYENNLGAFLFR